MKIKVLLTVLFLFLSACADSRHQTGEGGTIQKLSSESMSSSQSNDFSMTDIGVSSDLPAPKNIEIIRSSRFISAQEPTFAQVIGHEISTIDFDSFCKNKNMNMRSVSGIVIDCTIYNQSSPHIEFYFAHYNPYSDSYFMIGKYALFKTHSKIHPALVLWMPKMPSEEIDLSNEMDVENYLSLQGSAYDFNEQEFDTFVRSIRISRLESLENEWQVYKNESAHFQIDYPAPLGAGESFIGSGASIGVDSQYNIALIRKKTELDGFVSQIMENSSAKVERITSRVGQYDAEKILVSPTPLYVVPSHYGHFILYLHSYESKDQEYIEHMLSSFVILE